jgi:hypothetical protein
MIKLSKTSKLDGIMSWSLNALDTCQGSKQADGSLVDACKGSYGRAMMDAIKAGLCLLGKQEHNDYYRNHIPSRYQVVQGTVGSYDFVMEERGQEWADLMENA